MNQTISLNLNNTEDNIGRKEDGKSLYSEPSQNFNDSVPESKQKFLIKLIECEPALFDPKHEDYRSNPAKDILWSNISKRVGLTERYCKRKWKALRDQYCRELKRVRSNSKAVVKWKYFKHLDFMRPYALHREYRLKLGAIIYNTKEQLKPESNQKDDSNNLNLTSNTQNMSSCNETTSQVLESLDVTQISQSDCIELIDEDPQDDDDDDDDPIHTFLRIESYFEKQLITMVESEDVLYNHQNPLYRNPKLKMSIWEEIARKLKRTSIQCRFKWKSLRDQYIREYKRIQSTTETNSMPRWKHYDSLRFLENFIRLKNSNSCSLEGNNLNSELNMSIEHIDQEELNTPSPGTQYLIGDEDTSHTFADGDHFKESAEAEEENTSYTIQTEANIDLPSEESSELRDAAQDDSDEVGSFFKAVAIKIRKANMSSLAFTELQIDILKVISHALRDPS